MTPAIFLLIETTVFWCMVPRIGYKNILIAGKALFFVKLTYLKQLSKLRRIHPMSPVWNVIYLSGRSHNKIKELWSILAQFIAKIVPPRLYLHLLVFIALSLAVPPRLGPWMPACVPHVAAWKGTWCSALVRLKRPYIIGQCPRRPSMALPEYKFT